MQAAKATLAGHKAETKAAEDERDDYLDRKARFCKRRVAVPLGVCLTKKRCGRGPGLVSCPSVLGCINVDFCN